ncbi:endo-1,4-beta-xylanase [Lederbergia citrea]|uniref:Beta-xylanase n=1 Tax=Lederbergia citrea TaxID=2833581 RepID=A0A942UPS6_9BACI|nr:endo-1,4-beta-xylanase [Lederbergia citrea]MBS4177653.1 endo-1,4-beta-xylanase [Lederbergia citrea]MBS4223822.1 endo-1,4-beta-xylanase [Lederbergia citrea]
MKKMKRLLFICLVGALLAGAFTMQALANTYDTALQTVIDEFEALDENVYTPATYRLAKMEYDKVKDLIDDSNATPNEINDAINALKKRIVALRVRNGSEPLWKTYADYFEIGNIYSGAGNLDPSNTRGLLTSTHFNSLTAENHMKPDNLSTGGAGQPGTFRIFEGSNHVSDQLVRQAQENGITVHGHVLVWHGQSPGWLNGGTSGNYTRLQARENMEHYIKTVVKHFDTYYPGVVTSWDVVNEAFIDGVSRIPEGANWKNYLRQGNQSGWYKAYSNGMLEGEDPSDFIYDAFVFARKNTDAKLFYNDFNMYQDGKSKLVAMMAKELNKRYKNEYPEDPRQLIEGVGMQSHNYIMDTPPSSVENGILNLLSAGVDLIISELDLFCWFPWNAEPTGGSTSGYMDLRDRGIEHIIGSTGTEEQRNYWINRGITNGSEIEVIQAEVYAEYFRVYKNYAASIDRVTFWGLNDIQSWRGGHNPLLWNSDFSPKDAFYAVSDPEGYLGVDHNYVKPVPASKVAGIILDYNDIKPAYRNGKNGGNFISDVAKLMGPKTYFNNEPPSIKKGELDLSNRAYRRAVFDFLKSHPGMEDKIITMPPDTFFINSKK